MFKVLVVEDHNGFFNEIKSGLDGKVAVMRAATLEEGEDLFKDNAKDIDLIIMDACVPGSIPNAMPLVEKIIASGFKKPIIASSSSPLFSSMLLEVGATHESDKDYVAEMALALLKL